ncbi:preprotein translocase [Corynebacterium heidelbergense]|uniref:Membrane protein insertase YidC n=1 Tax=Corynebacterium heidelbergense TaxID=2055947 RepID=A0A364V410_9CORY|nr:preprotein translocase [Corynebacterium heidelbergense]
MMFLEYPVALVLNGWHWLFSHALGMDTSSAWVISIVFLVFTLRGLLIPLYIRQMRSSRHLANLRPQLRALEREFADKKDAESRALMRQKSKEIRREGEYSAADGCLPALIQIPVIIGLYRLLLRVARPPEGLEATQHSAVGPLSGDDVSTFLNAHIFGVPVPAYVSMTADKLAHLGTVRPDVLHLALPLAICASLFTTLNFVLSMRRSVKTMDYGSAPSRVITRSMFLFGPFVLIFPISFALVGAAPVAILMYWVVNNLWTLTSSQAIQAYLNRTTPYSQEFWEFTAQQKAELKQKKRKKQGKRRK